MSYREVYEKWCNDPYFDEASREELKALEGNEAEIEDRFYRQLEFGTGGLRGVIGAGTNRMNIYTVRQATQGLANYIISQNGQEKGVAIAHDSRRMSPEFAREAALCLNANGIKTYLFESLRPTPELSFAVREFGCISGIVITASHNPREYNGYKVYWEDGAQITPPHDKNILAEVAKVTEFSAVKTMAEDDARAEGLFQVIGTDFDDRYVAKLKEQSIHPDQRCCKRHEDRLHAASRNRKRAGAPRTARAWIYPGLCCKRAERAGWKLPDRCLSEPGGRESMDTGAEACKRSRCGHYPCNGPGCRPSRRLRKRQQDRRIRKLHRKYVRYADRRVHPARAHQERNHAGEPGSR